MRLRRTTRSRRREPLAVLATTVCVLAAVGCDAGSPLAPDFGVDETPAPPAAEERVSAHEVSTSATELSPDADTPPEADVPPEGDVPPEARDSFPPEDEVTDAPEGWDDAAGTPGNGPSGEAATPLRGPTSVTTRCRSIPPLIVIDGVVQPHGTSLSDLGHLDVDHVEIVKGRGATGIYGPTAANGAIEIRTKRGTQAAEPNGLKPR